MLPFLINFLFFPTVFSIIVNTSYGKLEGTTTKASNGAIVHLFKGIPQAAPPIEDKRFKLPEKPVKWEGTWNATQYKAACPSNSTETSSIQKLLDEDCLYINIFTSENCLKGNVSCPVIVYLHGGGLNYDSAVMFNDTFLVDQYVSKGIIFVIPSMRLGAIGLLHFEDSTLIPRNLPVYDVIQGIKYTNEEIHNFGGNNSKVTVMGHSMGAALVYALAFMKDLDPQAKLFQQILPISGPFYYITGERHLTTSRKILEQLGCLHPTESESFSCVSNTSWQSILAAQRKVEEYEKATIGGLTVDPPCMEMDENFRERLDQAPKRNMLVGATTVEFDWVTDYEGAETGRFVGLKNRDKLLEKFKKDKDNKEHPASKFGPYHSQEVFVPAVYYGAVLESKGAQPIASHSSDMMYFIGIHMKPMTPDRTVIMKIYNDMIVNFVKGEKPLSEFLPLNGTVSNFLRIESKISDGISPKMVNGYHIPEFNYWVEEMSNYDTMLLNQSAADWALPLAIGIVLSVIIVVVAVAFCLKNRPGVEETRPLLS